MNKLRTHYTKLSNSNIALLFISDKNQESRKTVVQNDITLIIGQTGILSWLILKVIIQHSFQTFDWARLGTKVVTRITNLWGCQTVEQLAQMSVFQLKSQECSLKISTKPLFIHNYKTKSRTITQVFNHQLAIQLLSKNCWPYGIQSILKRSISLRCQDRQLDDVSRWTRIAHNATKVARRITQRRRI